MRHWLVASAPHPLFGSIVVFGASLGACGGEVDAGSGQQRTVDEAPDASADPRPPGSGGAGATGSGGAGGVASGGTGTGGTASPSQPWECPNATQFFCDQPDGTCRCDATAPDSAEGCAARHHFACEETDPYPTGCRCAPERLDPAACPDPTQWRCGGADGLDCECDPAAPTDAFQCAHTAQFHCAFWEPELVGCWCDPAAPIERTDCGSEEYQSCHSYEPPIGCECVCCIIR